MNKSGPIIIIEDDVDDRYLLKLVFDELKYGNKVMFFGDGDQALEYLRKTDVFPFLILSDVNLPKLDGFSLRRQIQTNDGLARKCIPFLFFSTHVSEKAIFEAYQLSIQGFFLKPSDFEQLKATVKAIVEYWLHCYSPNSYTGEPEQP